MKGGTKVGKRGTDGHAESLIYIRQKHLPVQFTTSRINSQLYLQIVVVNGPASMAAEVEVGMIGEIDDCRRIRRRRVFDA